MIKLIDDNVGRMLDVLSFTLDLGPKATANS